MIVLARRFAAGNWVPVRREPQDCTPLYQRQRLSGTQAASPLLVGPCTSGLFGNALTTGVPLQRPNSGRNCAPGFWDGNGCKEDRYWWLRSSNTFVPMRRGFRCRTSNGRNRRSLRVGEGPSSRKVIFRHLPTVLNSIPPKGQFGLSCLK